MRPARRFRHAPLVRDVFLADPSARVVDGRVYVYGSHDVDGATPEDDLGSHFEMRDYRVASMDRVGGPVTVHDVALAVEDVPWASRQLWAPDALRRHGRTYLYFPAKDRDGVFRLGVATGERPEGPFVAEPEPIEGSFSIDPAVYEDEDGTAWLAFGGLWGGQLQRWTGGRFDPAGSDTDLGDPGAPALCPQVAPLDATLLAFAEPPRDAVILDEAGAPLRAGDHDRRFFEGPWLHRWGGTCYLSWSTGDTHRIAYATAASPRGPFTWRGWLLEPVQGWTTHHSIVEADGRWWLFYHDTEISGRTHLRNLKVAPLEHRADGTIAPVDPFAD